jgi:flavodoxin
VESIEELIRLREEAIQKLLEEKADLEAEVETLTAKLGEINEQLQRLGYQTPRMSPSTRRSKMYDYQEGKGFILVETGEVIGPGSTDDEALAAVREWCEKVGKTYHPGQWKRVIDPTYGRRHPRKG